jgi:glucose-1-phosphate thymidylyltransferase
MVYYPLSVLMLAGIREILPISTHKHLPFYQHLLGDGSTWGIELTYVTQDRPIGLAHALILGRDFVGNERVALILGDNLFCGHGLISELADANTRSDGATIFAHYVNKPGQYGVVNFDTKLARSQTSSRSLCSFCRIGRLLGFIFTTMLCSTARGELEITDVNQRYLELGKLHVIKLGRGYT